MTIRKYTSRSQQTTLTSGITASATTMTVVSATALLGGVTISAGETFTVVIDPDTALEEIVDVYSASGNPVSGNTLTIVRGIDGSSGQAHSARRTRFFVLALARCAVGLPRSLIRRSSSSRKTEADKPSRACSPCLTAQSP